MNSFHPHPDADPRYLVRPLGHEAFRHFRRLERELWQDDPGGQLSDYHFRLCTELYPDWCFIALDSHDDQRPVAYILSFLRGGSATCAALAVHPDHPRSRVASLLLLALSGRMVEEGVVAYQFLGVSSTPENRVNHPSLECA